MIPDPARVPTGQRPRRLFGLSDGCAMWVIGFVLWVVWLATR